MLCVEEPAALLRSLRGRGYSFRVRGDKILVSPFSRLSEEDIAIIASQRDAIIALLLAEPPLPPPDLEDAIRKAAGEVLAEANDLAELAEMLGKDLRRGSQLALLRRLATFAAQINKTCSWLVRASDRPRSRGDAC